MTNDVSKKNQELIAMIDGFPLEPGMRESLKKMLEKDPSDKTIESVLAVLEKQAGVYSSLGDLMDQDANTRLAELEEQVAALEKDVQNAV